MIRIISIGSLYTLALAAVIFLPGCVTTRADDALVCEAMRPAMPVKYHAKTTDAETTGNIRQANARFTAACP